METSRSLQPGSYLRGFFPSIERKGPPMLSLSFLPCSSVQSKPGSWSPAVTGGFVSTAQGFPSLTYCLLHLFFPSQEPSCLKSQGRPGCLKRGLCPVVQRAPFPPHFAPENKLPEVPRILFFLHVSSASHPALLAALRPQCGASPMLCYCIADVTWGWLLC